MGEYVWTSYAVGGKVKEADIEELATLVTGIEFVDVQGIRDAATGTAWLTAGGELNYGNHEDLDAFLIDRGLSFHANWSAASGVFDAGCRYWRPGMDAVQEAPCSDSGDLFISLTNLRQMAEEGHSIGAAIAALAEALVDRTPKFEIAKAFAEA